MEKKERLNNRFKEALEVRALQYVVVERETKPSEHILDWGAQICVDLGFAIVIAHRGRGCIEVYATSTDDNKRWIRLEYLWVLYDIVSACSAFSSGVLPESKFSLEEHIRLLDANKEKIAHDFAPSHWEKTFQDATRAGSRVVKWIDGGGQCE